MVSRKPDEPWYWWVQMLANWWLAQAVVVSVVVAGILYLTGRGGVDAPRNDKPDGGML